MSKYMNSSNILRVRTKGLARDLYYYLSTLKFAVICPKHYNSLPI